LVYPSVSWIDAVAARFVLNTVTGLVVVGVALAGLALATGEVRIVAPGLVVLSLALAALLGLGLGVMNCLLVGLFPAWGQVWAIASRPLFLVAGVIFVMEDLPTRIQDALFLTPWIHVTGLFRAGLYAGYEASYVSVPLVLAWALVPLAAGLLFLRKHSHEILQSP
jgi:capsular polysaccharide transport system permease protein